MWRLIIAVMLVTSSAYSASAGAAPKKSASAAAVKDTKPPTIEHTPVKEHDGKTPIVIEAKIDDDKSGVFEPTLLVRAAGSTGAFQRLSMTVKEGDVYTATIPAELLAGDIEYLLEAFDQTGNGPTRVGDENAPLKIVRNVPAEKAPDPTPVSTTPTPSTTKPVAEDSGPSGALIAVGVVAGIVVVAGAVVGGGYAYYALRPPVAESIAIAVKGPSPLGAAP